MRSAHHQRLLLRFPPLIPLDLLQRRHEADLLFWVGQDLLACRGDSLLNPERPEAVAPIHSRLLLLRKWRQGRAPLRRRELRHRLLPGGESAARRIHTKRRRQWLLLSFLGLGLDLRRPAQLLLLSLLF